MRRTAALVVGVGIGAALLYTAHRANLLTADHPGTGAEGGDEEADGGPGALNRIANSVGNLVSNATSLSPSGLEMLQQFEGFSATAYSDFKGYSIGFGHLIRAGESFDEITRDEAAQLLAGDVAWAERAVSSAVAVPLSQEQFDALVSLCYNIGETAFRNSTLVRLLNSGDYAGAAAQFDRWNRAGGVVNAVLVNRRAAERKLFQGGMAA